MGTGTVAETGTLLTWAKAKVKTLQEVAIESRFSESEHRSSERKVKTFIAQENLEPPKDSDRPVGMSDCVEDTAFFVGVSRSNGDRCVFCRPKNGAHRSIDSVEFLSLSPRARRSLIASLGMCYICGTIEHTQDKCKASNCSECQGRHHVNLHDSQERVDVKAFSGGVKHGGKVAMMIARVGVRNPMTNVCTFVNALLDTGNTAPFISKRAAKVLKLTGHVQDLTVQGVGG